MVASARELNGSRREPELEPDMAALGWTVPVGREVELPGRGTTFVRELPGPAADSPTVILLHGLAASGGLNWFGCFAELGQRFRVISIDHRGHGRGIRSSDRFRLADCADDVVALADVLGIEKFVPVGYSMGGPIGQLVWHRHPERVSGMVMCATSRNFRGRPRERVQFLGLGLMVAGVGRRLPWDNMNVSRVRRVVESMLTPELVHGPVRPWIVSELRRNDTGKVLEAADAIGRFSSHAWIGGVDVPVSVVVTTRDWLVPVRRQVKLARSLPAAVVFPVDGDHLVCANQPEMFGRVVADACGLVERRIGQHPGPGFPLTAVV
ncbi:MAG TPA: alpha/beta hydrolase [Acidimicrobiales bacterium]|nr:alpha/beta hydrolase [Acidimicrobiales bacterium]